MTRLLATGAGLLMLAGGLACGLGWGLTPAGSASVSGAITLIGGATAFAIACLGAGAGWRLAHPAPHALPGPPARYNLIEGAYEQTDPYRGL